MRRARALVHAWLVLDFFGDARRSGGAGSTLTTTIFTQSFLAFVFAALFYPETPPVPFAAANLCLSTLLVAVGALGEHDPSNRRRADQVLLATAPVARRVVVLARAGHATFHIALVTIGMALPPAILLGLLRRDAAIVPAYVAAACACSGLAAATLAVAVRGVARAAGHARGQLFAGTAKAVLLGAGVALFALGMQRLRAGADSLPIGRIGAESLLPYHAARLLAHPGELWRLLPFLGAAVLLALLAIAIGEGEPAGARHRARPGLLLPLLRAQTGAGPGRGIAEFVATSVWRSAGFRARVLPLLGLPAGMVFLGLQHEEPRHGYVFLCLLLQLPAIYLPFLIAFLPRADQPGAGWLFEQSPLLTRELVRDATWRALVTHVLLPVHGFALVLGLLGGSRPVEAAAASTFAFGVAVTAARPMLRALPCVPFTQDRDEASALDLGGLFAYALVLGGLAALFGGLLPGALRWPVAGLALLVAWLRLRRHPAGAEPLAQPTAGPQPQPTLEAAGAQGHRVPAAGHSQASLARELRAIGVLYAACSVLPALAGVWLAG